MNVAQFDKDTLDSKDTCFPPLLKPLHLCCGLLMCVYIYIYINIYVCIYRHQHEKGQVRITIVCVYQVEFWTRLSLSMAVCVYAERHTHLSSSCFSDLRKTGPEQDRGSTKSPSTAKRLKTLPTHTYIDTQTHTQTQTHIHTQTLADNRGKNGRG